MPRIRYIKPSFFDNEELGELKPTTRLLFIGLWCWADREGRLEDRPARLKRHILPYDSGNADAMLASLAAAGFITRYEAAGQRYIQVNAFLKHQRPHIKEVASTYPAPTQIGAEDGLARSGMGNGEEGNGDQEWEREDPPLSPADAGEERTRLRIERAKHGSKRRRDVDALEATQTPEERWLGEHHASFQRAAASRRAG